MKKTLITLIIILGFSAHAEELNYVEGQELLEKCRQYRDCIVTANEIGDLRLSLERNAPGYLEALDQDQTLEAEIVAELKTKTDELSGLTLSKASQAALTDAQAAITLRAETFSRKQIENRATLETGLLRIGESLEVIREFAGNYHTNLATITVPDVRKSYVQTSHRQYHYLLERLGNQIKLAKASTISLTDKNCALRIDIRGFKYQGSCGSYAIDPMKNFEGFASLIFDKAGTRSKPLTVEMKKKKRTSTAVYNAKARKLTLYYYTWSSWGWYGDSGTAMPSKSEVNTALGYELLK